MNRAVCLWIFLCLASLAWGGEAQGELTCAQRASQAAVSGASLDEVARQRAGCELLDALKQKPGVVITSESAPAAAEVDLSVPDSPAFAVLNVTPETVVRPTSAQELAVGILQGSDPNGVLQSGIAIEFSPTLFFKDSPERTLANYRDNYWMRFFQRSQFSLATVKATTDENALRLSVGYRVTLWDMGDPRNDMDLAGCLSGANENIIRQAGREVDVRNKLRGDVQRQFGDDLSLGKAAFERQFGTEDDFKALFTQSLKDLQQSCRNEAVKRNENRSAWVLGFAPTWLSEEGGTDDLDSTGTAFWTSLAYGFDAGFLETPYLKDHAQLILHARYRGDEVRESEQSTTGFIEQDTLLAALQLRVDGPKVFGDEESNRIRFGLDVSYSDDSVDDFEDDDYWKYSAFAITRMREDAYLKFSVGSEAGRNVESNEAFVLATVNWAFRGGR